MYFQKDVRKNHKHCYRFEVSNRKDLREKIIPFFLKHTLWFPSKRKDFAIFREIMKGIAAGKHLSATGLRKFTPLNGARIELAAYGKSVRAVGTSTLSQKRTVARHAKEAGN